MDIINKCYAAATTCFAERKSDGEVKSLDASEKQKHENRLKELQEQLQEVEKVILSHQNFKEKLQNCSKENAEKKIYPFPEWS